MERGKSLPPSRLVAFLRAVNVGGRIVKSADLKSAFSKCGFGNVKTFLASGNVVFDNSSEKAVNTVNREIESQLEKSFGFQIETFLRSLEHVSAIAESNPFGLKLTEMEEFTVHVGFVDSEPGDSFRKRVNLLKTEYDDFEFGQREIYWLCRGKKISDSELFKGNQLIKAIDEPCTFRKIQTLQRLVARE